MHHTNLRFDIRQAPRSQCVDERAKRYPFNLDVLASVELRAIGVQLKLPRQEQMNDFVSKLRKREGIGQAQKCKALE